MTASLFLSRPGTKPHATRIYQQGESFSLLKTSRNVFSLKLFKCGRGFSVRRQRCVLCLICRTVISLGYREKAGTEGGDAPLYLLFFSERAVKQTETNRQQMVTDSGAKVFEVKLHNNFLICC